MAPEINISLDQSEGSLLSDDFLDTPDDLDINVDDIETPDETDSLEFLGNGNELEWEGEVGRLPSLPNPQINVEILIWGFSWRIGSSGHTGPEFQGSMEWFAVCSCLLSAGKCSLFSLPHSQPLPVVLSPVSFMYLQCLPGPWRDLYVTGPPT